ncbi:MAG: S8 family serine peptidase, partial [Promethearchaeota archaeon]
SQEINEFLSKYNVEIHENVPYFNASIIYTPIKNLDEFISESESIFGISYIEPNFYVQLDFVPNDEYYESDQWDLPLIGMESAWEYEFGSHDVKVAVVDTGIDYTHPDLKQNYLPLGYDWVNNDTDPMDDHYHGTHCAGTIAGIINNSIGVAGIANVSVFAEKAFNSLGSGSYYDASLAIKHAVDVGANIISCSWGGYSYSEILKEAIEYAVKHNVLVVAAAGNSNTDEYHYPAAYPETLAVSATDQNDTKADFSNYGVWVDISAPGVDIISTIPYNFRGSYYGLASGTSMATPHVAGFAALLLSAYPTMNVSQIKNLIFDSAIDLGDPGFDPYYGYGRIDATTILGPDKTPPKYSNLIESADPLALGNTETIAIEVVDPWGVKQVIIEFEGLNHSMINIEDDIWQYSSWIPSSIGLHPYTIYMEDNYNNWGFISGSIHVIDSSSDITPPIYSNIIESADPLELGDTEVISIDVSDASGVKEVLIEIEGTNHSMTKIRVVTWQDDNWTPTKVGNYSYTIYMEDNKNYSSSVSGIIQVIDSTAPTCRLLTNCTVPIELGDSREIRIETFDVSGINRCLLRYEEKPYSMTRIDDEIWVYNDFSPSVVGFCDFTIFIADNNDNWAELSGSIETRDTRPPKYSDITESADPLILGGLEIITINGTDPSGINQVLIEFEGLNHSMINIEDDIWQYSSWIPSSIGLHPYTIYMEDNYNNWGFISGSIHVIDGSSDITPPIYSNLIESADPLELGDTEVISIDVSDPSGIKQVLIRFEGLNHTMTNVGENRWQYNSWTPSSTGTYNYVIYMEDNYNNRDHIIDSIQVLDNTLPSCYLLTNPTEPIELGNSTAILVKATDFSGIKQVIFQYEGVDYPMRDIGGDVWQFKQFTPLNIGICNYTIFAEDNNNNWQIIYSSVEVVDTQAPDPPKLIDFPLGNVSKQIIFDWEDGYDPSGIKLYKLIIDNESNPFLNPGFIIEVNITNSGSESSYFKLKDPLLPGTYYFFIYQIDAVGHQSSPATGEFTVVLTNKKSPQIFEMDNMILFLTIIIIGSLVGIPGYIVMKKVKMEKKSQPLKKEFKMKNYNIQIKNLKNKRVDLERKASNLVKSGDYSRASKLYKQCKNISNDLFKFGVISEAEKAKYYANMYSKTLQIQNQEISFIRDNINAFLTEYYNKLGINYYSNPEIYPENQNAVNGLILNDAKFLHHIFLHPKKGFKLTEELNINPQILTNFKGFQFIYTNDLSQQTISDYCNKYCNPEMLLLIVSVKDEYQINFESNDFLPQEKDINHMETVKCISYKAFANILGLTGRNRNDFLKIFNFSKDFNSKTIIYHNTEELTEILKQKKFYLFL